MNRLDFVTPEWTRVIWSNSVGKPIWEQRINRICSAWQNVEIAAICDGVRHAAIQFWEQNELVEKSHQCQMLGLTATVLDREKHSSSYSASSQSYIEGQPYHHRVVIAKNKDTTAFISAWESRDDIKMGELLGYPYCCTTFFKKFWVGQGIIDPTWCMVSNDSSLVNIEETTPIECNILLRWLGVRLVPHLPCSFTCEETVRFGSKLELTARKSGFDSEWDWINELLSQPIEYSTLHGAAEIKTPLFKISTRSDAAATKITIQRQGSIFPEGSSSGIHFPYKLQAPIIDTWSENGFITEEGMNLSHRPIVSIFEEFGKGFDYVYDLGCGNGQLLRKLRKVRKFVPHGIDIIKNRVDNARRMMPDGNFIQGKIEEAEFLPNTLVLINPLRIVELSDYNQGRMLGKLDKTTALIAYVYAPESLEELLTKSRLILIKEIQVVTLSEVSGAAFLR